MKKIIVSLILIFVGFNSFSQNIAKIHNSYPVRATWLHIIDQNQYKDMNVMETKKYLRNILDSLQIININRIFFQVRPEADAAYRSTHEPWSRYLTGIQGKDPGWDPLKWMIKQCHKRNIEIEAWINPYRIKANNTEILSKDNFALKHKELCVKFGKYLWYNPGLPQSKERIIKIVTDLITRYDIQGIHCDDYFYPYPIHGLNFNDTQAYKKYGVPKKITLENWRRENINTLIKELSDTIHSIKPNVRFGISPFGIYINKKENIIGSNTNGLSNYNDLYADVLLWMKNGWIDYVVPQLYWEIGNKYADYEELCKWWAQNSYGVPIYIGQDVRRTIFPKMKYVNNSMSFTKKELNGNQIDKKFLIESQYPQIKGNCFWSGYELLKSKKEYFDKLK